MKPRGLAHYLALLLIATSAVTACSPAPSAGTTAQPQDSAPAARKVLTIAARSELQNFADFLGYGTAGGGNAMIRAIAHSQLAVQNDQFEWVGQMATAVPSVEKGSWVVNPDGTMDTTWKLKPNLKWQDGVPFTIEDLIFSHQLHTDKDFTLQQNAAKIPLMESVRAADPQTLVVHWSKTLIDANQGYGLNPMPKHLLEESYQRDKDAFIKSAFFNSEFIGLGPYKIAKWDPGIGVEFTRFDGYFDGRPPLDEVVIRYISDGNTMVANILSGNVDVVTPPSVDLEAAAEVKRRWEGTGNQVTTQPRTTLRWLRPQYRPEFAKLKNGLTNVTVRKAMSYATDRDALSTVVGQGLSPAADSFIHPNDTLRGAVASAIPQYPLDRNRAQQLLAEAGWTKGSDGVLVDGATGERFTTIISARPTTGSDKDAAIIADSWKAVGVDLGIYMIPASLSDNREHLASQPTVLLSANGSNQFFEDIIQSKGLATEANKWNGTNIQGYSNPRVDQLTDRLLVTIDNQQRIDLTRQLVQEVFNDAALIPLYWQTDPIMSLKGVKFAAWNPAGWDKA